MFLVASVLFMVALLLMIAFWVASKKLENDFNFSSIFECGFTSYYFSRFSFSIHYYIVGLVFLFLDLELCFVFPLFNEQNWSESIDSLFSLFIASLLLGLLLEWKEGQLEWKF